MSELRILGKSVTVRLVRAGVLQKEITAISNFTFETRQRILTEGYLGETAQRQDEIFDEVGGSFAIVPESSQVLDLQRMIADRATKREANPETVTISFRAQFPDGSFARFTVPDAKFDPIPLNVGSRDAYVNITFTYKATKYLLAI